MTQIENEFGNYGYGDHPRDKVINWIFFGKMSHYLLFAGASEVPEICSQRCGRTDSISIVRVNKLMTSLRELNLCCSPLTLQL